MPDTSPVHGVDRHIEVEMTGNRREDTKRRAQAMQAGLVDMATDPLVTVRMALGLAYSERHTYFQPISDVIPKLHNALFEAGPDIDRAAIQYRGILADAVAARTRGNECGCHISKSQLELLDAALEQRPTAEN